MSGVGEIGDERTGSSFANSRDEAKRDGGGALAPIDAALERTREPSLQFDFLQAGEAGFEDGPEVLRDVFERGNADAMPFVEVRVVEAGPVVTTLHLPHENSTSYRLTGHPYFASRVSAEGEFCDERVTMKT